MARAGAALLLLLALPLAPHAGPADAQAPTLPGSRFPTQEEFAVGGLDVTIWVSRDFRTFGFTPDLLRELRDDPNATDRILGFIYNRTLAAGSLGLVYVRAAIRENGTYVFRASLRSATPLVEPTDPALGGGEDEPAAPRRPGAAGCDAGPDVATCALNASLPQADHLFAVAISASKPPGNASLVLTLESYRNTSEGLVRDGARTHAVNLTVLDPVPRDADEATAGPARVAAWVRGGALPQGASCVSVTTPAPDLNLSAAQPGVLCILARTDSEAMLRVTANASAPPWLQGGSQSWRSEPFNRSSGGLESPVTAVTLQPRLGAPVGPATVRVSFTVERQAGAAWEPAGSGELEARFLVARAPTLAGGPPSVNWLAQGPVLLATAGTLGYLAYANRGPRLEPRSQALRLELERKSKRLRGPEGRAAARVEERGARDRQRRILEAKRGDILQSIRLAEERLARGEITEHMLRTLKERKERELHRVEKDLAELRE